MTIFIYLHRYCGTKVPPVLTSLGNQLTIIFKTDHSVAQDGFMISYISHNKAQGIILLVFVNIYLIKLFKYSKIQNEMNL